MWSYTSSLMPFNTSTDSFVRHAAGAIHSGCLSTGLIQVNSQFQDITALTSSATVGAVYTNAVYRFADSLQSTHPVFINIQFLNRISGGATGPAVRFQVGTTHDGSGTIGGVTSSLVTLSWSAASNNAINEFLYSSHNGDASTGVFGMCLWWSIDPSSTNGSKTRALVVERTRDANGNITGDGVTMLYGGSSVDSGIQYLSFSASRSVFHDNTFYVSRQVSTNYVGSTVFYNHERGKLTFGRIFPSDGQIISSPLLSIMTIENSVAPSLYRYQAPLYGSTTGTFFTLNDDLGSTRGTMGNYYLAMRIL